MEHDSQGMLDLAFGLVGQSRKMEAYFLAHAMSDKARQPNAIAKVTEFDGLSGFHRDWRHLVF
jgi:hypothetical protein